jgi:hypothetical protein
MPLRTLLDRLLGRKVERHTTSVKIKLDKTHAGGDASELGREVEAELARQLSEGNSPEATRSALEEIARRHGGTVEGFEED